MSKKQDVERLRESMGRIIDDVETAFLNMSDEEQFLIGGHRFADMLRARLGLSQMGAGWQREYERKPGLEYAYAVEELRLAAWSPDPECKLPSTQIHMLLQVRGLPYPLMVRFTGPTTVNNLINEFAHMRDEVWPEAKGGAVVREKTDE